MDSLELINSFLTKNEIDLSIEPYLSTIMVSEDNPLHLNEELIENIIADAYDVANNSIKLFNEYLNRNYNTNLGRLEKNKIKAFLDYNNQSNDSLSKELHLEIDHITYLVNLKQKYYDVEKGEAKETFLTNLKKAILENNTKRVKDYLIFLYSRLLNFTVFSNISLKSLYDSNYKYIQKEFPSESRDELEVFCSSTELTNREYIVKKFYNKYIEIVDRIFTKGSKNYSLIHLNIDQELFNQFNELEAFYANIYNLLEASYNKLSNHHAVTIRISNVVAKGKNLIWSIFSRLLLFSENFVSYEETRPYYTPELICQDFLEKLFNKTVDKSDFDNLKKFYARKNKLTELNFSFELTDEITDLITSLKYVNTGFTFIDSLILESKYSSLNETYTFIESGYDIILVLFKNQINDFKIPCPICGSLKVSGNSFPEIGIRSWECKNEYCAERSKTNRGKRYSVRTIQMQDSLTSENEHTYIPKKITKQWRRDVINNYTNKDLYEMLIKYYSYPGDNVLIYNLGSDEDSFKSIGSDNERQIDHFDFEIDQNCNINEKFQQIQELFEKRFLMNTEIRSFEEPRIASFLEDPAKIKIINGNSNKTLHYFNDDSIDCAVTSPPYYNAREYSSWPNFQLYLKDMYTNIRVIHKKLKPGSIYLYNIGDTYDNENLIVKSKMGEKRIALGAYLIYLFETAGFELLDNIIWDKGEPQTNRHLNDGKNVPYYQRPANCFEHMFIFKKKGLKVVDNKIDKKLKNIQKFSPVIKIDSNGVNKYGHTAPYPSDIPEIAINYFSNVHDIILDPYAGSFTTGLTAGQLNRKAIGFEMNEEYFKLAISRINDHGFDILSFDEKNFEASDFQKKTSRQQKKSQDLMNFL